MIGFRGLYLPIGFLLCANLLVVWPSNTVIDAFLFGGGDDDGSRGRKCPYEVLGVKKDSTDREIRSAFLKLTKQYHPDVNSSPEATEKFKEINEANEIIGDKDKRPIYDRYGFAGIDRMEAQNQQADQGYSIEEMFSQIFNGFGRGGNREQLNKAPPITYPLAMSLDSLYTGEEVDVKIQVPRICKRFEECSTYRPDCQGFQIRLITQQHGPGMFIQHQVKDPECVAVGKGWKQNCKHCPDGPNYMEEVEVTVTVQAGSRHGERIVLQGIGQEHPVLRRGDLIFIVNEQPHPRCYWLKREGNDLHYVLDISLKESLLGFTKEILLLAGNKYTINQSGITPHNNVLKFVGKGMPNLEYGDYGDLLVIINVIYPKEIKKEHIRILEEVL